MRFCSEKSRSVVRLSPMFFQSSISTLSTLPLVRRRSIEKAEAQANFSALLAVTDTLGCGDLFEKKALKFIQRLSLS
jgi:hypothetical protein